MPTKTTKPAKPYEGFPLTPHPNGQWSKQIQKSRFYFGKWADDPEGKRALKEYQARLPLVLQGADRLRHIKGDDGQKPLGILTRLFLEDAKQKVAGNEMSLLHYGDYIKELTHFVQFAGLNVSVSQLTPAVFSEYNRSELLGGRKIGRHQRKKIYALIKRLFRWGHENGYNDVPSFGSDFRAPAVDKETMSKLKVRAGAKDYSTRIATGEEIDRLVAVSPIQFKAMILLGVNAGLGPTDLARLRWRHINFATGELNFSRGKTGAPRRSYLWRRTRKALERVATLKHNKAALAKDGEDALVFLTRKNIPFVRQNVIVKNGKEAGVNRSNAISITFARRVKQLEMDKEIPMAKGLTFYRLRHTTKTLGMASRDTEAVNLVLGHKESGIARTYDHSVLPLKRLKRVAKAVHRGLWPVDDGEKVRKPVKKSKVEQPFMRLAV